MKNKLILMFVLSISFKNMPGMIFSTMSNENTSEDTFFSDDEDEIIFDDSSDDTSDDTSVFSEDKTFDSNERAERENFIKSQKKSKQQRSLDLELQRNVQKDLDLITRKILRMHIICKNSAINDKVQAYMMLESALGFGNIVLSEEESVQEVHLVQKNMTKKNDPLMKKDQKEEQDPWLGIEVVTNKGKKIGFFPTRIELVKESKGLCHKYS